MIGSMALDGGTQYAGLRSSTNDLRLITGLATGFAIAMLLTPMLNDGIWRVSQGVRVLHRPSQLALWLIGVPVCYIAVWWGAPLLGIGFPVLVALAVLFTLTCVNLVLVCLAPPFERKAMRLLDVWQPALIALVIAILEVWLAGTLRNGLVALVGGIS
jgi:hypothetical protein